MKSNFIKYLTVLAISTATVFGATAEQPAPATPETYKDAMAAAVKLRGEKKQNEAAAAALRAAKLAQTPDDKSRALWTCGDIYWNRKLDPRQEKYILEALAVPGISQNQRSSCVIDMVKKIYGNQGSSGFDKAKSLIEATLAEPSVSNSLIRINLVKTLANIEFDNFKTEEAEKRLADLEAATIAANSSVQEISETILARARLAARKCDYAEATKQYARVHSDPKFGSNRMAALTEDTNLLFADMKYAEVADIAKKYLADPEFVTIQKEIKLSDMLVRAYNSLNDYASAEATAKALTTLETKDARYKAELDRAAIRHYYAIAYAKGDFAKCKAIVTGNPDLFDGSQQSKELMRIFFARGDYASATEVGEMSFKPLKALGWDTQKDIVDLIVAHWRLGGAKPAADFISRRLETMDKLKASERLGYTIVLKYLTDGKLTKDMLKALVGKEEGAVVKDAIPIGAKALVRLGLIEEPRLMNEWRQSLFVSHKRNMATVRYVPNAPTDFGSWQASGLLTEKDKHICDVKIGAEAAERLITDVAVIRGDSANASSKEESAAWFWVCYDEYGIHLLFENKDPKFAEVITGKTRSTDYEMYFGIGETGPAYQFGVNPTKREFDYCPPWNSPHKFYRLLSEYADFSSRPSKNGYATAMNISWELVYNDLPKDGTEWPFEMIHWSRSGGLTWGGTDIWQRSNWGHWKFEGMTPKVASAIHRVLVYRAMARYNAEKNIASGGTIGMWKDAELGDPEFYEKELKPLVEKLDAYAKEAEGEMDDKLADRLFKEAVPAWYDFKFVASELRSRYLLKNFTE